MRYSGINCPACGETFVETDDVVVCPVCGTPQHRECWKKENKCVNDALHAENFEWKFPEGMDPVEKLYKEAAEKKKNAGHPEFAFKNGEGVKICPRCGGMNYENDAFCMRCQAPLNEEPQTEGQEPQQDGNDIPHEEEARWQQGYERRDPRQLAIENQMRFGGLEPNVLVNGIPAGEISDYIGGKNPGRMIRRYASRERFGSKFTLSFAAMILGPVYFFYRKLYKAGAAVIALLFLISMSSALLMMTPTYIEYSKKIMDITMQMATRQITLEEYEDKAADIEEEYASVVTSSSENARMIFADILRYLSYFVYFGCGLMFDKLYLKKMKKDIKEARAENNNMEDYRMALMHKGGTTIGGGAAAVLLMFISTLATEIPMLFALYGSF